jgi:hypothetical protein
MRATEIHEESSWKKFRAKEFFLTGNHVSANRLACEVLDLEAELRDRIASQGIGWEGENPPLRYGVPDAVRIYKPRTRLLDLAGVERCLIHFQAEPCFACAAYKAAGL